MNRFLTMMSRSTKGSHSNDKKSNVVIKATGIPVTPKSEASSVGAMRERWLVSIYKEIENFLQNMAIEDADPSLVVRWKSLGKWPLPCQMVFVLKPLTQSQQQGDAGEESAESCSDITEAGLRPLTGQIAAGPRAKLLSLVLDGEAGCSGRDSLQCSHPDL